MRTMRFGGAVACLNRYLKDFHKEGKFHTCIPLPNMPMPRNTEAITNNPTPQQIRLDEISLQVLRAIEVHPNLTQRQLASVLGVSLGKAHYCIKALIDKGLVKMGNFSHNQHKLDYAYLLTPKGVKSKATLTMYFLERKAAEYEQLKADLRASQTSTQGAFKRTNTIPFGLKL